MDSSEARGGIKIGRIIYQQGGRRHIPKLKNFTNILVMINTNISSNSFGSLGPYCLKDNQGRIMENIWQFSKVYQRVPKVKECISKYNQTIAWNHPEEIHVLDGTITNIYWKWRKKGLHNKYPVRYPVGFKHRHKCLYSILQDGEKLDYIQARKKIYLPTYQKLALKHPHFKLLKDRLDKRENLLILEVDGPHQESLNYYIQKYGVNEDFVKDDTIEATSVNLNILLNDDKHPFGHGYCLAALLKDIDLNSSPDPKVLELTKPMSIKISTDHGIFIYGAYTPYPELTNFSNRYNFKLDNYTWSSVEHYYQSNKFSWNMKDPRYAKYIELIRTASTAIRCKQLGIQNVQDRYIPYATHKASGISMKTLVLKYKDLKIDPVWDMKSRAIMYKGFEANFKQNPVLMKLLLETGNRPIYKHSAYESIWSNNGDGTGLNQIGCILMKIRTVYQSKMRFTPIKPLTFYNAPTPFPNSNWVTKNLLVGEYPGDLDPNVCKRKVQGLMDVGINYIISLIPTSESSQYKPYKHLLVNKQTRFFNFPIPDMKTEGLFRTKEFVRKLIILISGDWKVYLHCLGGHGRTGLIVSVLLGYMFKLSANDALNYCQALHFRRWKNIKKRKHPACYKSPQTNEQFKQVRMLLK